MTPEQLSANVRAGDKKAIRIVVRAVRDADGHLAEAASALGIGHRTLTRWGEIVPELAEAIAPLRAPMGRPRVKG